MKHEIECNYQGKFEVVKHETNLPLSICTVTKNREEMADCSFGFKKIDGEVVFLCAVTWSDKKGCRQFEPKNGQKN